MYRTAMAPDAGMLFDFHAPQLVSFWMENTVLPLDMLFVRADGTIARIKANATPYSRENIPAGRAGPTGDRTEWRPRRRTGDQRRAATSMRPSWWRKRPIDRPSRRGCPRGRTV